MPHGATPLHIYGIACLAGVGFTMSLFIGSLSFSDPALMNDVRLGVLSGSILSGIMGYAALMLASAVQRENWRTRAQSAEELIDKLNLSTGAQEDNDLALEVRPHETEKDIQLILEPAYNVILHELLGKRKPASSATGSRSILVPHSPNSDRSTSLKSSTVPVASHSLPVQPSGSHATT